MESRRPDGGPRGGGWTSAVSFSFPAPVLARRTVRKDGTPMKQDLHPELHVVTAVCACGNTFQTRSTSKELRLEICSACHPFFTGRQKFIDTAGRVERFKRRYSKSA